MICSDMMLDTFDEGTEKAREVNMLSNCKQLASNNNALAVLLATDIVHR